MVYIDQAQPSRRGPAAHNRADGVYIFPIDKTCLKWYSDNRKARGESSNLTTHKAEAHNHVSTVPHHASATGRADSSGRARFPLNIAAGEWLVKSESNESNTYHVNVNTGDCPCPDHANNHYCKHLIAAKQAAEIARRSTVTSSPTKAKRGEWLEGIDD